MAPETHALLSASSADRWLHCPGSVRLTEGMPERTSQYAEEGRLAHAICELKLRKYTTLMKKSTYEKKLQELKDDPSYNPEMDGYTDTYFEAVKAKAMSYGGVKPVKPAICVEQRVDYSSVAPEGYGTADAVLMCGNDLHVYDFKYGKGVPVSAVDNPQLKLYAIGALDCYGLLYDIRDVYLHIIQPRLDNISEWHISTTGLRAWGETIRDKARAAYDGAQDFAAGDWCRFCRAKALCRTRAAYCAEPYDRLSSTVGVYSPEEFGSVLDRADAIAAWAADVKERAMSLMLAGTQIPGYKLVEGRRTRRITDPDALIEDLASAGYDRNMLYERKPLPLTRLESVCGKAAIAERGQYITIEPGKPAIAPDSDSRQDYITASAAEAFADPITN